MSLLPPRLEFVLSHPFRKLRGMDGAHLVVQIETFRYRLIEACAFPCLCHPMDEDLSMGAPVRETWGTRFRADWRIAKCRSFTPHPSDEDLSPGTPARLPHTRCASAGSQAASFRMTILRE